MIEIIQLKNCPKCGCAPELIGSGLAKTVYDKYGNEAHTYFVDFDGYNVECSDCCTCTKTYMDIQKSIDEWNNL